MPGAAPIAYAMLGVAIWSFFGALELSVQESAWKTTFSKIQYLGIECVAPFWYLFAINFTGIKTRFSEFLKKIVWIIPAITVLLALTNEFHHLIWTSFGSQEAYGGILQIYNHGSAFYLNMVYAYTLLLIGTIFLFRFVFKSDKFQKQQIIFIMLSAIIPWVANFLYLFNIAAFPGIDSIAFAITGVLLSLSVFRFQIFDLVPMAKRILFSTMNIGFIILDKNDLVVEANPISKQMFEINFSMGADFKQYFASYPSEIIPLLKQSNAKSQIELKNIFPIKWLEISISQISDKDQNSSKGKLLVIYDITERKLYEKRLIEAQINITAILENTEDIIVYINKDQKLVFFNSAYAKTMLEVFKVDVKEGMSAVSFLDGEDRKWWSENNLRAINGDRFKMEYSKIVDNKEKYFEVSFNPILVSSQLIGVSEFTKDITERKLSEKKLQEKVAELERLNNVMVGRELKMIELKKEIGEKDQNT